MEWFLDVVLTGLEDLVLDGYIGGLPYMDFKQVGFGCLRASGVLDVTNDEAVVLMLLRCNWSVSQHTPYLISFFPGNGQ